MNSKSSVIFISILIFWLFFAPKSAIIQDSGWITNSISLFLLWYVRHDLKYIFVGRNRTFNLLLLAFFTISVYSVYYNAGTIKNYELTDIENPTKGITSIKHLLYYSIGTFASSLYIQRISNTKYIRTLLKTFIILSLIVLIPTFVEIITTPIEENGSNKFSIGNKFTIGYYHLYLCAFFYFLNNNKHKFILFFLTIWMVVSSIIIQCSTTIVGALIFMFLSLFSSDSLRNYLGSSKVIIISLLVFDIGFFFLVTWFLQYDFIQYIVVDVLNEDLTLTGRIPIYMDIQEAFIESPWIGFGYGNSTVVAKYYTDAYDSQNGLVELFIQIGAIGVVTFLFLVYTASKALVKNNVAKYAFTAFIYAMICISTVEIPYKYTFIFFLSFCFIQGKGYRRSHK